MSDFNDGIEKLKPCPFCGGEAVIIQRGTKDYSTVCCCTDCGCRLASDETDNYGEAWNTRPTPDRSEARERIATLIEEHVVVTTYRDGTHDLDETLTAADAILATGLVQDEASIRADEGEK